MARITEFLATAARSGVHPTTVECGYQVIREGSEVYLQLSTFGSDERSSAKKVSQTIQLDRAAACRLVELINETFPGL